MKSRIEKIELNINGDRINETSYAVTAETEA